MIVFLSLDTYKTPRDWFVSHIVADILMSMNNWLGNANLRVIHGCYKLVWGGCPYLWSELYKELDDDVHKCWFYIGFELRLH